MLLNNTSTQIQTALSNQRLPKSSKQLLSAIAADLTKAKRLIIPNAAPASDYAVATQIANYFGGVDSDGRPHSQIRYQGRAIVRDRVRSEVGAWYLAGMRLLICAQLDLHHRAEISNEPSLRKARLLMEDRTKFNRKQIDNAWASHKCVAHIAAAVIIILKRLRHHPKYPNRQTFQLISNTNSPDHLIATIEGASERVVDAAKVLETYFIDFKPSRQKQPLISRRAIWQVAGHASSVNPRSLVPPLAPADLDAVVRLVT